MRKESPLIWGPDETGDPGIPYLKQLTLYVIFCSPLDAPWKFVLRRQYVVQDLGTLKSRVLVERAPMIVCCCLSEVRKLLPLGLHRIPHQPGDPLNLLETWI